jgi:hypothetical protein
MCSALRMVPGHQGLSAVQDRAVQAGLQAACGSCLAMLLERPGPEPVNLQRARLDACRPEAVP